MDGQRFNFAHKFPQNRGFVTLRLVFLEENYTSAAISFIHLWGRQLPLATMALEHRQLNPVKLPYNPSLAAFSRPES